MDAQKAGWPVSSCCGRKADDITCIAAWITQMQPPEWQRERFATSEALLGELGNVVPHELTVAIEVSHGGEACQTLLEVTNAEAVEHDSQSFDIHTQPELATHELQHRLIGASASSFDDRRVIPLGIVDRCRAQFAAAVHADISLA